MQKIYNIYRKKTPEYDERKFEQMERHTVFSDRNIQHHEKSILIELIYEVNTISVKNTNWILFGRGTTQANSRVPMTKESGGIDQEDFKTY